ncbi:tetratricopeptide repeat protein [Gemmatimonadota bacterium]
MISRRYGVVLLFSVVISCTNERIRSDESPAEYATRLAGDFGADFLVDRLNALADARGEEYMIDGDALTWAGYQQLMSGNIETSLVLQEAATTLFPQSARAWENLGEVGVYLGDRELAQRSFERAVALDSTNDARWRIDRLDQSLRDAANETDVLILFEPGEPTGLVGPYFGQSLPGAIPEVFAPGIVSTRGGHEFSCSFTPDGREFYFNRGPNIYVSYWREDGWTAPEFAAFNSDQLDHEPFIASDASKLFFGSGREREGAEGNEAYGIWVMERLADGWGPPEYLFPGMFVTTAASGNAYVTDVFYTVGGGICLYPWDGEEFRDCQRLRGGINSGEAAHPLIAPDESFLIFDGDDDLYISFPLGDGSWSAGVRIDEISDLGSIMTASLSPDGRVLFFYANHDIYWVSTEVLQPYVAVFLAQSLR